VIGIADEYRSILEERMPCYAPLSKDLEDLIKYLDEILRKFIELSRQVGPLRVREKIKIVLDKCEKVKFPWDFAEERKLMFHPEMRQEYYKALEDVKMTLMEIAKSLNEIEMGVRHLEDKVERIRRLREKFEVTNIAVPCYPEISEVYC